VLGPKRQELAKASAALQKAQQRHDQALSKATELEAARSRFSGDYHAVLRLGKAIPSSLDMPAVIVQLDKAARGTGIKFDKVSASQGDTGSSSSSSGSQPSTQPPASPAGKAAPGGASAATGPGRAAETAGNTVKDANGKSAAADQSGAGKAAGGSSGSQSSGQQVAGLQSVPLDFAFRGSFFQLANLFHRLKPFVQVANGRLVVRGRLMTVDSFNLTSGDSFPSLTADIKATVYLVPKSEGTTGGATPAGPTAQTASSTSGASAPSAPPTATATP
jgi:hypothetical protein